MEKIKYDICPKHGKYEFVLRSDGHWYCKKCCSEAVSKKRKRNKKKLVEYKGGKCEICGYNKCIEALDFHHKDPNEKDFNIASNTFLSLKRLKKEVDKCSLLCSNCHREIHAKIEEAKNLERQNDIEKNLLYFKKNIDCKFHIEKIKIDENDILLLNRLVKEGKKQSDIANVFGVSVSTIKRYIKQYCIDRVRKESRLAKYTVEQFELDLKEMPSFRSIAKKYGVSDTALRKWRKKHNLSTVCLNNKKK